MLNDKEWAGEFQTDNLFFGFKIKKKLFEKRSKYQKISIYDTIEFGRMLLLDDVVMLAERDEFIYHEMLVHPAMGQLNAAENILIVGGGDGGTLREVLKYPVKKATIAEIDEDVILSSKEYLPFTGKSFKDRRANIIIGDAAEFVAETDEKFDAVFVDSADPIGASAVLFSEKFIKDIHRILNKGGIVVVQSESPFYDINVVENYLKFMKKFFTHSLVYLSFIPTYPSGMWSFVMARDRDIDIPEEKVTGLKYFNPVIFQASQALPNWICNTLYPEK